jgi:hypothetical protein
MPLAQRSLSGLEAVILYIAISYPINKILGFVPSLGYFEEDAKPYYLFVLALHFLLAPLYAIHFLLAFFYTLFVTLDPSIGDIVFYFWLLVVMPVPAYHLDRWIMYHPPPPRTMDDRQRRFMRSFAVWCALCMPFIIVYGRYRWPISSRGVRR